MAGKLGKTTLEQKPAFQTSRPVSAPKFKRSQKGNSLIEPCRLLTPMGGFADSYWQYRMAKTPYGSMSSIGTTTCFLRWAERRLRRDAPLELPLAGDRRPQHHICSRFIWHGRTCYRDAALSGRGTAN